MRGGPSRRERSSPIRQEKKEVGGIRFAIAVQISNAAGAGAAPIGQEQEEIIDVDGVIAVDITVPQSEGAVGADVLGVDVAASLGEQGHVMAVENGLEAMLARIVR